MPLDASLFESLGANCEFGFFLEHRGNSTSTLFKWAEVVGIDGLTRLIQEDFQGLFEFENLAPFNHSMVMDKAFMIAWHSSIHSEIADPTQPAGRINSKFTATREERHELWRLQHQKMMHFVAKIRSGLRSAGTIYVYKPRLQDKVSMADIVALHDAMRIYGPTKLLVVTVADRPELVGRTSSIRLDLVRGYVDRFAPGDKANEYSADAWTSVCINALQEMSGLAEATSIIAGQRPTVRSRLTEFVAGPKSST